MLKSKIEFAREARKKVSAFPARHSFGDGGSLSTLRPDRIGTAEDGQPSAFACSGFTLLEMLMVIAILGIIAGLTVPVLKNFRSSDATLGASRQLLDGVARARQLAISQRTTVYMVFLTTNFWIDSSQTFPALPAAGTWWGSLPPALRTTVTNLADRQLSGYNFVAKGATGDQPGRHAWHYLERWQGLPEGTFIAWAKFTNSPGQFYIITNSLGLGQSYPIYGFHITNNIPFPAEQGTNDSPLPLTSRIILPYLAFNYLGQLTFDGQTMADRDEFIPLAHGSVLPLADPGTKALVLTGPPAVPMPDSPDVSENPPGNSTNSYNIVHIDRLTGRAVLEFQKVGP